MAVKYPTDEQVFARVREELRHAKVIAWDGCHKIYLALDEVEAKWFRGNYEYWFAGTVKEKDTVLRHWWRASCPLRFVSTVKSDDEDPNNGYTTIVGQNEAGYENEERDADYWDNYY